MFNKLFVIITSIILLVGCATPEYRSALQSCEFTKLKQFPPKFELKTVNRVRYETVPDGTRTCSKYKIKMPCSGKYCVQKYKIKTHCKDGTRQISVPYTEVISIDVNKNLRDRTSEICAKNSCVKTYGNTECKKNKR